MVDKSFERTIVFEKNKDDGNWYPIVKARFLTRFNNWITLPLLFDTGASIIVLRRDHARSFARGPDQELDVVGRKKSRKVRTALGRLDLFGLEGPCAFALDYLPPNSLYQGLLGRAPFSAFGFGFWESVHELYLTVKP
jgi:hypothetical protein